ncbi:hypothetical protein EMMF5_005372 [Cystobasidiomycetes sp. EMM_F5]
MLEAPKRAVKFAANDWWGQTYRQAFDAQKPTQALSILTGCSAGATESVVVVPFELVKIRLQDRNSAGRYKGPMDCVSQILKNEGVLGFYNGLEPTFWRYWAIPSLFVVAREEGFGALYKGFLPKVLRLAPGGGLLLLVVEFTLSAFRKQLGPPYI